MSRTTILGYTPVFQINKDGDAVTSQFNDRVLSIQVESNSAGGDADKLTLSLDDRDWAITTPANDGIGQASLDVYLGYAESGLYEQGSFAIGEIHLLGAAKTMRLHGVSAGFQSNLKSPVIRAYEQKTLKQILDEIASSGGVTASVEDSIGSTMVPFLNQHSSHMHMLQDLERRFNGLAKISNGVLSFTTRGTGESVSGIVANDFELVADDIGSWDFCLKDRTSYSGVKAGWFDKVSQQVKWLKNTVPTQGLSSAPFLMKKPFASEDEAQKAADAQMGALNRGMITGNLTLAKGDPSIHGGAKFTISGMKSDMNGTYNVKRAVHLYTKDGGIATNIEFFNIGVDTDFIPAPNEDAVTKETGAQPEDLTPVTTPTNSGGIGRA